MSVGFLLYPWLWSQNGCKFCGEHDQLTFWSHICEGGHLSRYFDHFFKLLTDLLQVNGGEALNTPLLQHSAVDKSIFGEFFLRPDPFTFLCPIVWLSQSFFPSKHWSRSSHFFHATISLVGEYISEKSVAADWLLLPPTSEPLKLDKLTAVDLCTQRHCLWNHEDDHVKLAPLFNN